MNKLVSFGRLFLGSVFVLDGKKRVKMDKMHAVNEDDWEKVSIVYPGELCMMIGKVSHKDSRWSDYNEIVENPISTLKLWSVSHESS